MASYVANDTPVATGPFTQFIESPLKKPRQPSFLKRESKFQMSKNRETQIKKERRVEALGASPRLIGGVTRKKKGIMRLVI